MCFSGQSYADGELTFERSAEDGKGKCPFDPFQRYASIMVGELQPSRKKDIGEKKKKNSVEFFMVTSCAGR